MDGGPAGDVVGGAERSGGGRGAAQARACAARRQPAATGAKGRRLAAAPLNVYPAPCIGLDPSNLSNLDALDSTHSTWTGLAQPTFPCRWRKNKPVKHRSVPRWGWGMRVCAPVRVDRGRDLPARCPSHARSQTSPSSCRWFFAATLLDLPLPDALGNRACPCLLPFLQRARHLSRFQLPPHLELSSSPPACSPRAPAACTYPAGTRTA